eukprot:scaffold85666_cov26-Tisochrysis_lutea.AAC.1
MATGKRRAHLQPQVGEIAIERERGRNANAHSAWLKCEALTAIRVVPRTPDLRGANGRAATLSAKRLFAGRWQHSWHARASSRSPGRHSRRRKVPSSSEREDSALLRWRGTRARSNATRRARRTGARRA